MSFNTEYTNLQDQHACLNYTIKGCQITYTIQYMLKTQGCIAWLKDWKFAFDHRMCSNYDQIMILQFRSKNQSV